MAIDKRFKKRQCDIQSALRSDPEVFGSDSVPQMWPVDGRHPDVRRPSLLGLADGRNNLHPSIRESAVEYFSREGIKWWRHTLFERDAPGVNVPSIVTVSSQIACVNHLFPIRRDREAVLAVANALGAPEGIVFSDVLSVNCESDPADTAYVGFEACLADRSLMGENGRRGEYCTSVDALIHAVSESGEKWLIPVEWKYTELYPWDSSDLLDCSDSRKRYSAKKRLDTYLGQFRDSPFVRLVPWEGPSADGGRKYVNFFNPFYELSRQAVWAATVIANASTEPVAREHGVDRVLHVCMVPDGNTDLIQGDYGTGKGLEETWRSCLGDDPRYVFRIADPGKVFPVLKEMYPDLVPYLEKRYWN